MLEFADISETATRLSPPACGPSTKLDDPANDPKGAAEWGHEREVRAELIRWLFVDPDAARQVDPSTGPAALGARVVGILNLDGVHAPFIGGPWFVRSAIPDKVVLDGAELDSITLSGSRTGEISAANSQIHRNVDLGSGFDASARVLFLDSRIDGDFYCMGGSFKHNKGQGQKPSDAAYAALVLSGSKIEGSVWLSAGFQADGMVQFDGSKISGSLLVSDAKFTGKPTEPHGLSAPGMSVGGFFWQNVELPNGATLDLRGASANALIDDERSWPRQGSLAIDGFNYGNLYGGPSDAPSRLRWINLESGSHPPWLVVPAEFHSQAYRELAKVLRERGDNAGAQQVLIAEQDARYAGRSLPVRLCGEFLKYTIGYGHRPLLAIFWMLGVVVMGCGAVVLGKRAGVMRLTWPETTPPPSGQSSAGLSPLLYSLDVFLPFVNLHQEHYWWPDESAVGACRIAGLEVPIRGSTLRIYLWFQIIAGWLLSAVFVAGVTGLIRND